MKKKLAIALIIVISALTLALSPNPASAEECPDVYVQPAICNTDNPPGDVVLPERPPLAETGENLDWTGWMVGGILLLGGGIVIADQARRKFKGEK